MPAPKEFISFLAHYHGSRDYFECHEILEEYWKEIDPGNKQSPWVAFILLAVSNYHHRRGNIAGAEKTLKNSIFIFTNTSPDLIETLGVDYAKLMTMLQETLSEIQSGETYRSKTLPISDIAVTEQYRLMCKEQGIDCKEDIVIGEEIIHRHMLRDRSGVIKERERQKQLRAHKKK
ncbi:MAG: DUF309 domain-containing protein [Bacillus sp. (in: firmicutes)]